MERMTGVEAASSTVLHAPLRRGAGGPRPTQGFPACEARAQATGRSGGLSPSFLFHVFFTFGFSFSFILLISVTFTFL